MYRISLERRITTENNLIKLTPPDMMSAAVINYKADNWEQIKQLFKRAWIMA